MYHTITHLAIENDSGVWATGRRTIARTLDLGFRGRNGIEPVIGDGPCGQVMLARPAGKRPRIVQQFLELSRAVSGLLVHRERGVLSTPLSSVRTEVIRVELLRSHHATGLATQRLMWDSLHLTLLTPILIWAGKAILR